MCNGESTRTTQGGTIAILKPTPPASPSSSHSLRPCLKRDLSLRLAPAIDDATQTTNATIEGLDGFFSPSMKESQFVIHRTGDLRADPQGLLEEECVLHRFAVPGSAIDRVPFSLERRLDLGVGGEGIIGRRVSFLQGRCVLGEGIIGWN